MENFNDKELNILLSFYCKKITKVEFLKNLNSNLFKLYINYLLRILLKIVRFKN